ncbi:MAG: 50S ribosomal protein L10 [Acidobacteria bacterium]|nr:50S ribosomal protein L10 [Acidobacteriota bacterium]
MNKVEKTQFIKDFNTEIKDIEWAFLFDYSGLTVEQINKLRRSVRNVNSHYKVVKNNLAKKAIKGTAVEGLTDAFVGPVAMAWTSEDPVSLAKALVDFSAESKKLQFKAGIVSGKLIEPAEFKQLSSLPSREELLAKLLYVMNSPIRGFVTALNEINAGFVRVLAEVKRKKEQSN